MNQAYEAVIGLEVHAQLKTRTKAFCGCSTEFGAPPNINTCPVCLGHPGALPVLNQQVVELTLRIGLATNCFIRSCSIFARKNYFYPDLPKGYQISQYEEPICTDGWIDIELDDGTLKRVGISRIHMEEDAGKSIHDLDEDTLVDLNRCGVPLIEIVSKPDLRSPREAYHYMRQIRQLVRYLEICDGNLEEGSLRCDANVSVRRCGESRLGTKTEVKNLNSFRNLEKALEYEIQRHVAILEAGGQVEHETRLWDAVRQETRPMRTKEHAHDYRYFPEPDLVPVVVTEEWRERVRVTLPELPLQRKQRLMAQYGLPAYDAGVLCEERAVADYFEACCAQLQRPSPERYKMVSNWIMTEVLRILGEQQGKGVCIPLLPEHLAELVELYADDIINSRIAKDLFAEVLQTGRSPRAIVSERELVQVSDTEWLRQMVEQVIGEHPDVVIKYRSGKTNVLGFLVGQVLQRSRGRANPKVVTQMVQEQLQAQESSTAR
ncbi:MAG: Asp-tRNA(Asn)/Glu-tRNA(Gln) amidotransferase subunit GatB [Candidatus Kapabacteria bacterium]|nr:Asp-tRNA(Asn)/Glu-tRNA(Gln) amidotransferase subunit GatB [Candidatus Kapabacteria bacterium]MCS7169093.1 Asp-tRNA(Asn)/Glu-tRNA(Gln) amidotransferase subunit GatB [Candidatus Kapabacteria bacterium]MDW7996771.1 Asp-tRNA(Asn)/Glu-tRNA(Gln) amidotransferase subunit GatB [Bacteroidota bacterium]MDW8224836.1 Asp-tRNA(Asn)/Glu-tRNA(Gln) amidotransferase subunit GatB [Bacteroidota bacterium]